MAKVPISVVVLTKNEENHIEDCLKSVVWADEIIVVDDLSTDATLEIASRYAHRIISKKMEVEGAHRNWAYSQAKNNWVLSLDADERVTPELKDAIEKALEENIRFTGFTIRRRNYIGTYWVRRGGWHGKGQLRLFLKDKFRYEEVGVHPRAFLEGECGHIKADLIHYSYEDFADFLAKLNTQSTQEALKWLKTGRKMSLFHAFRRTIDRFFRSYIGKGAWREGFMGFMISYFASLYQIASYAKFWEMKRKNTTQIHTDSTQVEGRKQHA